MIRRGEPLLFVPGVRSRFKQKEQHLRRKLLFSAISARNRTSSRRHLEITDAVWCDSDKKTQAADGFLWSFHTAGNFEKMYGRKTRDFAKGKELVSCLSPGNCKP